MATKYELMVRYSKCYPILFLMLAQARQMIIMGFAAEVYNQIPCSKVKQRLASRMYEVTPDVAPKKNYVYQSI